MSEVLAEPMTATLDAEVLIARARTAARRGDLDEAERLLCDLGTGDSSSAALDLLARIHAQRGELTEADAYWARVQTIDPDDQDAVAGRQTIAEIVSGRRRARPVFHPGRAALLAAVLTGAVLTGAVYSGRPDGTVPPGQVTASAQADIAARLQEQTRRAEELEGRLTAQQAQRTESATWLAGAVDALAADLALPGVRVDKHIETVRVVFDEGLFSRSDEITPAGAALLAELGRRLAGKDVSATITGHVVAVPGGRTSGGSVVALARALVAARALAEGGGIPLTAFTLISAEQTQGPFPDPARNRTITLTVAPNEPPPR